MIFSTTDIRKKISDRSCLIFLPAEAFDPLEYLIISEGLKREGIAIFITSDTGGLCVAENGSRVKPEIPLQNINAANFTSMVLVGGPGVSKYFSNLLLIRALKDFNTQKKTIAAICAAPVILGSAGILTGRSAACHPKYRVELQKYDVVLREEEVVLDQNILTASTAHNAREFLRILISLINR